MKKSIVYAVSVLFASLMVFNGNLQAQHKYVGETMCAACHKGAKGNNIAEKWKSSAHAKAFETLKSQKSKDIAAKMKISDPTTSDKCTVCHVTNMSKKEEGVSCESCHGPGSDYKNMQIMKNPELAKKNGLILGKGDAELCKKCHNPKSPTYKSFDYNKMWAMIKHPLKG